MWGTIPITVHFLEVTSEKEVVTKKTEVSSIRIYQVLKPDPRFAQWLYQKVGSSWYWIDRYFWSLQQWKSRFNDPRVTLWVMEIESHNDAQIAGYYELDNRSNKSTEISYFGLMGRAIGKGLGAHMLSDSLQRAFTLGANRVWLHTCSLDHPNALTNYEARGMRVYKTVQDTQSIPPGWPYSTTGDW
tara:strand:- start:1343 stop:1903 length:561 start_codon:yes stop_codon:yes gene_type:complete